MELMKNRITGFILLLMIAGFLSAQGQESYIFHHFSTADGLLNNEVKAVIRDRYGFLWIGTMAGLNRYDGCRLKSYTNQPDRACSLPEDDIESLAEDAEGNLWIRGRNTYFVYHRAKDCFLDARLFLERVKIPVNAGIDWLHVDACGDLWVVAAGKICHYRFGQGDWQLFTQPGRGGVSHLADDGQKLFLMDHEGALFETGMTTEAWNPITVPHDLPGLNGMYRDKSGATWLYSSWHDTLCYRQDGSDTWQTVRLESAHRSESNFTRSIQDDGHGQVWIATDHKGLFLYNKVSGSQVNILHHPMMHSSITENNIGSLCLDSEGILWVGYVKKGLSCYHPSFNRFANCREPQVENISAVLEDRKGRIWIGTDGNGLVCKPSAEAVASRQVDIPGNIVVTLLEDRQGRIWIGTYLHGLLCYDEGHIRQYTTGNSRLSDNSVYSLRQDSQGRIWVGTLWGHLQCLHPETGLFEDFPTPSKDQSIAVSMYYEGGDTLYAGMISGLCLFDIRSGRQQLCFGNRRGTMKFRQAYIQSICRDRLGNLWLGHNQGVTVWDQQRDTLYYLDKTTGLCDNVVRSIALDNPGRVWVTTSNGCSVVRVGREPDGTLAFHSDNYSTHDGLLTDNFSRHSLCLLRDGRMLLGGVDGYSVVNLDGRDEADEPAPRVLFTGLQIANTRIEPDVPYQGRTLLRTPMEQQERLKLEHSDRLIRIEYTALNLLVPNRVRYAYRLEGLNREWFYTTDASLTFNSLPPGHYRLLLKACNAAGAWGDEVSTLHIDVAPPFYLSWYAYLCYVLLAVLAVFLWWKHWQREQRIRLEQQRIQLEHEQAIRLNEMKLRFFTNVSHDFRTPLTLIITPLQRMLENQGSKGHEELKTVYRNAEQLLTLVNQLLDFRKLDVGGETLHPLQGDLAALVRDTAQVFRTYADERRMTFCLQDEAGTLLTAFDADKVRKIVINLLSNAFKYTPDGGSITLRICRENDLACISVTDTGTGISDADKRHIFERFFQTHQAEEHTGSGIGLHIVSEYVRLHRGKVRVTDNTPQGSIFTVCLPIVTEDAKEIPLPDASEAAKPSSSNTATPMEQEEPVRPTLLIVEDNRDLRDFMARSLGEEFRTLTAANGQEALDVLVAEDVNLIISDVMMPVMDGIELCRRVKTDIQTSHIPVLLLTARTADDSRLQGLEQGADDYLTKPFNYNVLVLRIRKFLEWTEKCHRDFRQKADVSPSEITITPLDEQLLTKAIQVVEEHIDNSEFSVEDLSAAVGLTRGHLYKKLMNITGKSPSDFIRILRLKRARQLLAESQMQVAEVAYSVGFSSPKIFSRNFKAEFGMTPTEFVKGQKNDGKEKEA